MALRLRIVGEQAKGLGESSTKVFGVHGGSIGRSRDNDWILPDPDRYMSGSHARVDFRAGSYVLVDVSSNGTYVNDASEPLGKFHEYTLQDGDFLRLGSYEFRVSIDATNDFPPDASSMVANEGGPPNAATRTTTANDLGADLDLSELLETGVRNRNIYGQALLQETPPPRPPPAPASAPEGGTPWHMMTRPIRLERPEPLEVTAPPPAREPQIEGDVEAGFAALCRGAGIEPRSIPPETRAKSMQLAGQLLREAVLGLMDLQQGRNELRNRLNVGPSTSDSHEFESPLNLTQGGVQEILVRLLSRVSARSGSVDAMREKFRDLKAQNTAMVAAMQCALSEVLARFSPQELEERFQRSGKRGVFGAPDKGKYWDLYADMYSSLTQRTPDGFPHLFVDTFARDFDAKMREFVAPRRGKFGGGS